MNRKIKQLNAFSGHSPLLYGDGGHSPLLSGDEETQGSPHLEVIGKSHDAKINVKISLSSGERISVRTER